MTLLTPALAFVQAEGAAQHGDPVAPVLIWLMLIALGAAIGAHWMKKLGQPAVLGELLIGVITANVAYYFREPVMTVVREGPTMLAIINAALAQNLSLGDAAEKILIPGPHSARVVEVLRSASAPMAVTVFSFIDQLSRVAVIILLFLVGLENSVKEMGKVGLAAFLVAVIGVVCPFLLGIGLMAVLMPESPLQKDIFIGAILTATSVGITARVFRDLQQSQRTEAKIILGAAVIDDVLGLVILAVVTGLVVTGSISVLSVMTITFKAVMFLAVAIGAGMWVTQRMVRRLARLEHENVKLLFGLGLAFLLSWLANSIGLATIVGAFAAGLVLEEFFLEELKGHPLRDSLAPLETLVVPVFFVLMGMQVKLETLADRQVVLLAAALTAVAIIGKLISGLGVSPKLDRLSIGVGMMPRGEVGLIFASIGKGLGVVSDALFSAVVIMVMLTTLLAPPLLKITLARSERRKEAGSR